MSYRNHFTRSEWETLQFASFWVFTMVAAIDGQVDNKEATALAQEIAEAPLYKNLLAREVLISVRDNLAEIWQAYRRDSRDTLEGLREVNTILAKKASDEDAIGFKMAVLGIGAQIVKKSSKAIFGQKNKDREKAALVLASIALAIKPD